MAIRRSAIFLISSILLLGGFFCWPRIIKAAGGDIVINEIMWMGSSASIADEWIELKNTTNSDIDLSGWSIEGATTDEAPLIITASYTTISAHGFFLISNYSQDNPSSKLNVAPNLVTTTLSLPNTKLLLVLKNSLGEEIDHADDGVGQPLAGDNTNKYSMERNDVPGDGSLAINWHTATTSSGFDVNATEKGTPSSATPPSPNPICNNDSVCDSANGEDTTSCLADCPAAPPSENPPAQNTSSPGDIAINEFVADPTTGEDEWVELYNKTSAIINLSGAYIEDASQHKTLLSGDIAIGQFFIVSPISGNLNNSGDAIYLKNSNNIIIDQVIYGKTDGNAPLPTKSNQSVARKSNGIDTNNDANDFALSDEPTKGGSNVISRTTTQTVGGTNVGTNDRVIPKAVLYINELAPDPADDEEEWVEIFDAGETSVELDGWYLEDGSGAKTTLSGTIIPGQFMTISPINGSLNNSGDLLYLKDNQGNIFDRVAYGTWDDGNVFDNAPTASDPFSIARLSDGYFTNNPSKDFVVAITPTKNKSNQSTDLMPASDIKVVLNEILPDPESNDSQNEFIEIRNLENRPISLAGWYLKNAAGKKYILKETALPANGFLLIKRSQSNLTLNNNAGALTLFTPNDKEKDKISYAAAKTGYSFARDDNGWSWTNQPTPGGQNIIATETNLPKISLTAPSEVLIGQNLKLDASDSSDENGNVLTFAWTVENKTIDGPYLSYVFNQLGEKTVILKVANQYGQTAKEIKIAVKEKITPKVTAAISRNATFNLKNIYNAGIGAKIKTQGVVIAPPGILGKQIFYIGDQNNGLQIYMYKKDFPELKIGDLVQITGEISEAQGERRIKVKEKADIVVLKHNEPLAAKEISALDIEENLGTGLVSISGTIIEARNGNLILDDNGEEVTIFIKSTTQIDSKDLANGGKINVTGLLIQKKTGWQILPRFQDDIKIIEASDSVAGGETATGETKNAAGNYLAATAGGLTSILLAMAVRGRALKLIPFGMLMGLFKGKKKEE